LTGSAGITGKDAPKVSIGDMGEESGTDETEVRVPPEEFDPTETKGGRAEEEEEEEEEGGGDPKTADLETGIMLLCWK
jgi:hypothetical protein